MGYHFGKEHQAVVKGPTVSFPRVFSTQIPISKLLLFLVTLFSGHAQFLYLCHFLQKTFQTGLLLLLMLLTAPITTGITVTFFILQICGVPSFRGQYFSIFLVSLVFNLKSLEIATIIIFFLYVLSNCNI